MAECLPTAQHRVCHTRQTADTLQRVQPSEHTSRPWQDTGEAVGPAQGGYVALTVMVTGLEGEAVRRLSFLGLHGAACSCPAPALIWACSLSCRLTTLRTSSTKLTATCARARGWVPRLHRGGPPRQLRCSRDASKRPTAVSLPVCGASIQLAVRSRSALMHPAGCTLSGGPAPQAGCHLYMRASGRTVQTVGAWPMPRTSGPPGA